MPLPLLPLYLRKEPTTDPVLRKYAPAAKRFDVVAYRDPEAKEFAARWNWFSRPKPDKRFRRVTLNCFRWAAVWLPDLA